MHDHSGHTPGMPEQPKQRTPSKPDAPKQSAPAKPDPHAGHDMGKSEKPGTPRKGAEKK